MNIVIVRPPAIAGEISQLMDNEGQATIDKNYHYCNLEVYDQLAIDNGFSITLKFDVLMYSTPDDVLTAWISLGIRPYQC